MKPVNVRSMFAVSAQLCEKAINNEDIDMAKADMQLKNLSFMLDCLKFAHSHSVSAATIEGYEEKFQAFNPQIKNFDALTE